MCIRNVVSALCSLGLVLAFAPGMALAQFVETEPGDPTPAWEDPATNEMNREPAHATLYSYSSVAEARAGNRDQSDRILSLNGTRSFTFAPGARTAPTDFREGSLNGEGGSEIPVPASWEMQGFGIAIYINIRYPFTPVTPPVVPEEGNAVGSYHRIFEMPRDWGDRQVTLHFGSVSSAFSVAVGQESGAIESLVYER